MVTIPLRPLVEKVFAGIDSDDLSDIGSAIQEATEKMTEFDAVKELQENIRNLFVAMSGPRQDANVTASAVFFGQNFSRMGGR